MAACSVARRRVCVRPCTLLLPRCCCCCSKFQPVFQFVSFGAARQGHLSPADRGELRETTSMLSISSGVVLSHFTKGGVEFLSQITSYTPGQISVF